MDFEKVFAFLLTNFEKHNIRYALMGGLALHASGYSRATEDIDILILKEDMPKVKDFLLRLGYTPVHESEDVSNFRGLLKELGQIDFLHAHREYTKNMLKRARDCAILEDKFRVKVLKPEDLIGLKVQAGVNDPKRETREWADIEHLLRLHKGKLDLGLIQEYFALFGLQDKLHELLVKVDHA